MLANHMILGKANPLTQRRKQVKKLWLRLLIAGTFALGGWQILTSGYLLAKAHLAQWLIADAWALTLKHGEPHAPWSWADTHPVAKLTIPTLGKNSYILAGANGRNMAFGPAHVYGSGMPGQQKSTVLGGHNDSHFNYLAEVQLGDLISIETVSGKFNYKVSDLRIIDSQLNQIVINEKDQLILATCYPFNALTTGGKLRYQVTAERM